MFLGESRSRRNRGLGDVVTSIIPQVASEGGKVATPGSPVGSYIASAVVRTVLSTLPGFTEGAMMFTGQGSWTQPYSGYAQMGTSAIGGILASGAPTAAGAVGAGMMFGLLGMVIGGFIEGIFGKQTSWYDNPDYMVADYRGYFRMRALKEYGMSDKQIDDYTASYGLAVRGYPLTVDIAKKNYGYEYPARLGSEETGYTEINRVYFPHEYSLIMSVETGNAGDYSLPPPLSTPVPGLYVQAGGGYSPAYIPLGANPKPLLDSVRKIWIAEDEARSDKISKLFADITQKVAPVTPVTSVVPTPTSGQKIVLSGTPQLKPTVIKKEVSPTIPTIPPILIGGVLVAALLILWR